MTTLRSALIIVSLLSSTTAIAASSEPMACTMEAKLCPDGKTYVGRDSENGCAFRECPPAFADDCAPYQCADGTTPPSCNAQGNYIMYVADPCLGHGSLAWQPFDDVPVGHPNAQAIAYMKAEGIVEGYADGTFKPDETINRAEFVKILMGTRNDDPKMCKIAPFPDIDQSAWYAADIHEARCDGLVEGYPDGAFKPANSINFAEASKIIVKTLITTDIPFFESGPNEPWYKTYVSILSERKLIPLSIGRLDQRITRGEMAEMLWRKKMNVADHPSVSYAQLSVEAGCVIGGCSAELCTNADEGPAVSNCMYVPAYACYGTATCERQANGSCGWTETPALRQCLGGAQ